ncbi:acyl carrier protein [Pseudoflavonifractor phocaeensis]|uniref:acyl carrier protein n=1 Tax=Pseudoflavonifractor phocaeensis TaxID=1870988 RepID=UPI003085282C|nr:acyl carrier protein [Oscillospiraceae bacterium]
MIFETVAKLLSEQFGMEPADITEETSFEDLGADSVDIVELSMALEEEFDIEEMGEEDLTNVSTVGDLVNYLKAKLGE